MQTLNKTLLFVFIFLSPLFSYAQIDSSEVNQSPYGVIYNHLYYLQEDSYDPAKASLSFPTDLADKQEIAIQLKRILDGKGMYVDINRLPKNPEYVDTLSNEAIYFIDRDESLIYVEKINGAWQYSRTTIEQTTDLYQEVYPFGTKYANYFQGPFWDTNIFGITLGKWFGLLILLFLGGIFFYIIRWVSKRVLTSFLKSRMHIPDKVNESVGKMARILGLFLTVKFFQFIIPMFQLPVKVNALVITGLGILAIFFLILLIAQISRIIFHYLDYFAKKTHNTLDDQLMPVVNKIVNIIIWVIGIIYILEFLDVNVTALLAGISIGGLALALAAQDTVKNFLGSIMIFIDRPFQIGDWINFGNVDGTVEEVGVRSTRIRTFANSVTYVPNGMLANTVVNNMGLRIFRRFKIDVGVTYDTPPHKIDLFVKGIRNIIQKHPTTRKDFYEVHLNSFGASSINVLIYCFFQARDWTAELKGRHDIIYAIMILAEELGVSFAFPSQSLYIESMPGEKKESEIEKPEQLLDKGMERIEDYFQRKHRDEDRGKIKPLGGE